MKYRHLGNSGLLVSELSFGSWVTFHTQVDVEKAYELMLHAYKAGINFFDNAEAYAKGQSEEIMGKVVKLGIERKEWHREDLVLSTKIFWGPLPGPNGGGLSRKHIIEGTKASLKRLDLEYVDLLFCHRPDPQTPIEETVRAMNFAIDQGWAFYWGTSEWSAQQISEACRIADKLNLIRPVMDQPQYNIFERKRVELEYQPLYNDYKYGLTIWSPLASGLLTGKYSGNNIPEGSRLDLPDYKWLKDVVLGNPKRIEAVDRLKSVADKIGCSLAQLAVAWCVANPHVSTVILGATKISQLDENLKSLDFVSKLTPELLAEIDEIAGSKPEVPSGEASVIKMRSQWL